jgi:predicted nucleic acid-binding protein
MLPAKAVDAIISRIAMLSRKQLIYYLWRPLLPDPKNDMVLELAIASGASHIVTFNYKDLHPAVQFGIAVVNPSQFIQLIS